MSIDLHQSKMIYSSACNRQVKITKLSGILALFLVADRIIHSATSRAISIIPVKAV